MTTAAFFPVWDCRSLPVLACGTVVLGVVLQMVSRVVTLFWRRYREEKQMSAFPGEPKHWFYGNILDGATRTEVLEMPVERTKAFGPVRLARLGLFKHNVALSDPEGIKAILSTAEPKEDLVIRSFKPWIGDGLLVSKGKKWVRNRRLLTPAFHFEILKPYVSVYSSCTQVLVNKWKAALSRGPRLEMFESISLMTLDILLRCAFNYDLPVQHEGRRNPYISAIYSLSELFVKRLRNVFHQNDFLYYFSYNGYKFRQACRTVQDYSRTVIQARREQKSDKNEPGKRFLDFLDILLEAKDASGVGLTDEEIQNEVDTFMFEGHDTTASGISWFMYNMAAHPEHQQKCHEEVMKVLGDRDDVMWEDLRHFEYLTLCLKESLRIHPPVPVISRKTTKPLHVKNGLTVPAGVMVTTQIYAMQHNPDVWENPDKYDPLRFTPENSKGRSPHAFVPFSAGPRNCIGQNFAMNEMKTSSALLLKYFEFSLAEKPIKYPELILRTKDGLWLNVKDRNAK